jgi:hypothetical protein
MHEPAWFAAFLFCAMLLISLKLIGSMTGEKAAARKELYTQLLLGAALVYLVLWAGGVDTGPFVAWR